MTRYIPLILMLAAGTAVAGGDWLTKASKAVRTTDYRGTLVYLRDGNMDTLRVVHRYCDGRERERLVSQSGQRREIIRNDGSVTAVLPDQQMVLVADHSRQNLLSNVAQIDSEDLDENYRVRDLGKRRQAGRMCRAIAVEPKDEYRYGYRLLIDEKTHLPLKLDLVRDGEVLEQLLFTDISFPETIPDTALEPTFATEGFRWVRHKPLDEPSVKAESTWQASKLPPGFELAETGVRRVGGDVMARQLLFTDGVATVSAFIAAGDEARGFSGETTMGAVNAFGRQVDGHQITVVGEVPEATVRQIAEHIRNSESRAASAR